MRYNSANILLKLTRLSNLSICAMLLISFPANSQPNQISKRIEQGFTVEKTRKNIRSVGDGTIAQPQIKLKNEIIRLPAAPSASAQKIEVLRRKKELKKLEERYYKRPLILSAGVFKSANGTVVQLAHIIPTTHDKFCQSSQGKWPCGRFAKAALQRLVRSNTIICSSKNDIKKVDGRYIEGTCKTTNYELAKWLVTQGWTDSNHADFIKVRDEAKANGLGIWRQ